MATSTINIAFVDQTGGVGSPGGSKPIGNKLAENAELQNSVWRRVSRAEMAEIRGGATHPDLAMNEKGEYGTVNWEAYSRAMDTKKNRELLVTQNEEAKKKRQLEIEKDRKIKEETRVLHNNARGVSIPLFSSVGQAVGGRLGGMLGMGFGFQAGASLLAKMGPTGVKALTAGLGVGAAAVHLGTAVNDMMGEQTKRLAGVSGQFATLQAQSEIRQFRRDQRSAAATGGTLTQHANASEDMADAWQDAKDTIINTIGPGVTALLQGVAALIGQKEGTINEGSQWDEMMMDILRDSQDLPEKAQESLREIIDLQRKQEQGIRMRRKMRTHSTEYRLDRIGEGWEVAKEWMFGGAGRVGSGVRAAQRVRDAASQ